MKNVIAMISVVCLISGVASATTVGDPASWDLLDADFGTDSGKTTVLGTFTDNWWGTIAPTETQTADSSTITWSGTQDAARKTDISWTAGDWTLEMWFRHEGDSDGFPWGASSTSEDLMGNLDLGVNVDGFLIEIEDNDPDGLDNHFPDTFRMRTDYSDGGTTNFRPDIPEGVDWAVWHHIVFTTLAGTGSIYLDGALVDSTPWNVLTWITKAVTYLRAVMPKSIPSSLMASCAYNSTSHVRAIL